LAGLTPVVQQRLLDWLDEQYEDKRSAYYSEKSGDSFGSSNRISSADQSQIKELRKQLETIRAMNDEDEMKKVLHKTGWAALSQLLRLNKSTISSFEKSSFSEPDDKKVAAARKAAEQVGQFRYELRKKMGKEAIEPRDDLRGSNATGEQKNQAASISMSRKAASVLEKNEKLKGEIPRSEYEGILELNHWRISLGMDPLLIDPKLCEAARDHSKDMESLGFFAHDSPVKGKAKPWDRAKNFGTTARGENIAINDSTNASNMAWFYSPGHHKNMFKEDFSVMGLGIKGRHYTQLFR
jgi:uncharacterized protein YkwD